MKNYASGRANKGKTAYRTPSVFRYKSFKKAQKEKSSIRLTSSKSL